jgi:hypothetical protein
MRSRLKSFIFPAIIVAGLALTPSLLQADQPRPGPNPGNSPRGNSPSGNTVPVPEPSALMLIGLGVGGAIAFGAWRRRRGAKS